ncbi:MAG: four helix bundle protein [Gemmataceae bacterium]|nr:four helix bundle protein [Gemmataceae bacterium]
MGKLVQSHTELESYRKAFEAAMELFERSKGFPKEETYSLTDQIRRSSRSVCANLAEAWRRRRYRAAFINKLNECEGEAAETQTWIEFAVRCGYLERERGRAAYQSYEEVLRLLVAMICDPDPWILPEP